MPRESMGRTLAVAAVLCVVCSIVVSGTAVVLKPTQDANRAIDKKKNVLIAAGFLEPGEKCDVDELFKKIDSRVVDLATGRFVADIVPDDYDEAKALKDEARYTALPREADIAGIKRRANYRVVYFTYKEGHLDRVILPVHGKGLWSTMYGFLALSPDLNTVANFGFYEHGETPGLGGEIEKPKFTDPWRGKRVFDPEGKPIIEVVKGVVRQNRPEAIYQVDGISGATLTGDGVTRLIRFWLGDEGYGPLLVQLEAGELKPPAPKSREPEAQKVEAGGNDG